MNRLVVVGNGLDLAHGLKTGYNDFILWYLNMCLETAHEKGIYEDGALMITANRQVSIQIGDNKGCAKFVDYFYQKGRLDRIINEDTFRDFHYMYYPNPFKIKVKHPFIYDIITNCSITQWVDIENNYYRSLTKEIEVTPSPRLLEIESLNLSMSEIISKLEQYLSSLPTSSSIEEYRNILESMVIADDLIERSNMTTFRAGKTLVLNFNYTSTIEQYFPDATVTINYIHGKLNDQENPLVFGYGDELDKEYEEFERNQTPGKYAYIKSFWYFRTRNYHNLIRFIQGDTYQVVILGHSCGLSDRTMLNMIFEDPNCKSVKIYHHVTQDGKDNYTDITHALSVHFKNKQEMRKKIVPFNKDNFMPQSN